MVSSTFRVFARDFLAPSLKTEHSYSNVALRDTLH